MRRANAIEGWRSGATPKSRNVDAEPTAIVRTTLKCDADAAVVALSTHFMMTMHLVELATPKTLGGGDAV